MTWKRSLARWLDPDHYERARRYYHLCFKMQEARDWMASEFPVLADVYRWADANTQNHFRSLDDARTIVPVPGKPWIHQIGDFREHMRAKYLAATLTPDRVATPGLSQSTQAMPLPSEAEERATNSHQGE